MKCRAHEMSTVPYQPAQAESASELRRLELDDFGSVIFPLFQCSFYPVQNNISLVTLSAVQCPSFTGTCVGLHNPNIIEPPDERTICNPAINLFYVYLHKLGTLYPMDSLSGDILSGDSLSGGQFIRRQFIRRQFIRRPFLRRPFI